MEREKVISSMITSVGYDADAQLLEIEFAPKPNQASGPVYQYAKFQPADWTDFRQSKSIGKHFRERISGIFAHTRVGEPVAKPAPAARVGPSL
jgi:hypothetical protein